MDEIKEGPIYFSKILFEEGYHAYNYPKKIVLLNLAKKELSYQVVLNKRKIPAVVRTKTIDFGNYVYDFSDDVPARIIKHAKNDYEPMVLVEEPYEQRVLFSYAIKLSKEQMEELLPYCNALDFEPYRGKKMTMYDEGNIGYRDEVWASFAAVTDSYIPYLTLPMDYYYDEEHIWPSEKLYRYLVKTYFQDNKKLKKWGLCYGESSLFCVT